MKTKIAFAISMLAVCFLPIYSSAQGREKIYQITDEGKYYFVYVRDSGNGIIHPITPRTFYLETNRMGLISRDINFTRFQASSDDTIRAMLNTSQSDLIASLNKVCGERATQNTEIQPNLYSIQSDEPLTHDGQKEETALNEEQVLSPAPNKKPSWMVMAVTQPGSEATPKPIEEISKDTTYTQARTKLPWVVQLMLVEGEEPYKNWYDRENIPFLTESEVQKRIRLHDLVLELLAYNDDSIQMEYGRVFPGMDGKLYGVSDPELDEMIQALLNMKEDFLASSKPELHQMFNEMEALAMSRSK